MADYALVVANADYSVLSFYTHIMEFHPLNSWTLTNHPSVDRAMLIRRNFWVSQGSTASWTQVTADSYDLVFRHHATSVYEDDFDVTAIDSERAFVELSGFTGSLNMITRCDGQTLQLKRRVLEFRRGSLKFVGPEENG